MMEEKFDEYRLQDLSYAMAFEMADSDASGITCPLRGHGVLEAWEQGDDDAIMQIALRVEGQ